MRTLILISALVAGMVLPPAVSAQGGCPVDSIYAACGWVASSAPSGGIGGNCSRWGDRGFAAAQYDLILGTSRTRAFSADAGELFASCRLGDVYTLSGPPSPEPRQMWVQLTLAYSLRSDRGNATNSIPGECGAGVTLTSQFTGTQDSVHAQPFAAFDLQSVLVLPITVAANEPFEIRYATFAWGTQEARANLDVAMDFAGVPPGYTVTSCQGFTTDGDVPVTSADTSWGRLKALFR